MDEAEGGAAQPGAQGHFGPGGRFAPVYLPVAAQQAPRIQNSIGARIDAYADDDGSGPMYGATSAPRVIRTGGYVPQSPQRMAELAEEMRRAAVAAAISGARPADDDDFGWSAPATGGPTLGRQAYADADDV